MNNTHSLSAKEIKDISRVIVNVVKRNKITKLGEIQDRLLSLGYERKYTHFANLKYVLNEVGINKLDGQYTFVRVTEAHSETKECWRCETDKPLGSFKKCYRYIRNYLNICNTCIKDESRITGESVPELNAIYEYLQHKYANSLDKSMYGKFWELAIYGKRAKISV
jgi:hypothetical protein